MERGSFMKKLVILGLFLCQSILALSNPLPAEDEALRQRHERVLRALTFRNPSMYSIARSSYQKSLAKEGPLTIEFIFEKDPGSSCIHVTKAANDGASLSLLEAQDDRSANSYTLKFKTQEQTPFAKLESDATGWQLRIDDGGRNKLNAHISWSGNLTISSGQGIDTLEIKISASLTFNGDLAFPKINLTNLETSQVVNKGIMEVGALSLKQSNDELRNTFTNEGYIQLTDLHISNCSFYNKNKITSNKQFNLDLENSKFVNDKIDTKTSAVEVGELSITGNKGEVLNKGELGVVSMKGYVDHLTNEGIVHIKSSEKEAMRLKGQTFKNIASWHSTCGMELQFYDVENSGSVTMPTLTLQFDGSVKNNIGAKLTVGQIDLSGKGYLTNSGAIVSEHQLNIKANSTTNEGLLSAKDLLKIDNDGRYFKNTAEGKIQTEGVLQIAATGPWLINGGEIVANEIQSQGVLFNVESGSISGKRVALNGQLHNGSTLTANELNAHMQSIGGEGKLLMTNGQVKIDGDHAHIGKWSCSGDCVWSALKFSNFGNIEGKVGAQLTVTSNEEFWNDGNLYCAAGAACTTVSTGKTVNSQASKIIPDKDSVVKQQSGSDAQARGTVEGGGSYIMEAVRDVIQSGMIDIGGHAQITAGRNAIQETSVKSGSFGMRAGETAEIKPEATIQTTGDTSIQGKNIDQDGKITTGGEFTGKAQKVFTNPGEIRAEEGLSVKAGQKIVNPGTLSNKNGEMKLEALEVINPGKILSKEDLKIFASKLFLNEGGTVNIGRDATITADTVQNVAGRILIAHLLTINAKKLENKSAPIIMKPGEACPQPPLWESGGFWFFRSFGRRTCQGDYEVIKPNSAAVISSMGEMVLNVGDGTNVGSTIYAKGNITITGKQFRNLAQNLKNYKVTKSWRHWETCTLGIFCRDHYEPTVNVVNEPTYVAATMGSDGKILVNGGSLENTGNVKSAADFNFVSDDITTKFVNGLSDPYTKTAKKPEPKTGNFDIYPYMDTLGNLYFFNIAEVDEKDPDGGKQIQFLLVPGSKEDQDTLNQQIGMVTRGLSERLQIAYLQKENETSPLTHRFIMHPQLSAQIVQSMLATELGTSHLSGFEGKTAMEQYEALATQGYQYAQKMIGGSTSTDALPLKLEQITKAEETFIYYDLVKHEGITGYVPVLHIGLPEAKKHVPGTEGTIEASNILVETAGDVENTGTLKSTGKLKITSHLFKNRRREYKATETVKEQDDIWGNTRTRVFEVRTPEIGGDIIGVDIELTAKEDLVNEGGKIVGAQKVYLISEKGNIEHKALVGQHVVHWHQCGWDKAMSRDSAGEALDYYSAEIISGGEVKLDAKVNKVLVKASEIIGTGDVNVSGYSGVSVNGEMSKHTTANTHNIMGNGNYEEVIVSQRSTISSLAGNVTFKVPEEGTLNMSATTVTAPQGAVILDAKNVNLGVQSLQYTKSKSEAAGGFSIGSTKTEVVQTAVEPMVITALKGLTMKAAEDNVLEAVFVHSGGYIHIVAGRDNRFKGFEKKTDITTEGWNIGISFPGSDAVEKMMGGKKGDAIKSLRDGDPLLSAMDRLRQAQDTANKVGEGTYVAIEALRALDQYLKMSEQPGATASGMLGQRMGLTDAKGNFAPQITLHVGAFKSETHMTDVIRTSLDAKSDIEITSVQNTYLLDGTIIKSNDRMLIVAQDVTTSPAQDTIHSESQSGSFSVGYGAAGWSASASASKSHSNTFTNHNVQLNADKIDVRATNLDGKAVNMEGKEITLDVKNNLTLESVQDTASGSSTSIGGGTSFTGGSTSGSASFTNDSVDKARVNTPTGIHATESLKIKVGGTLYLIGGVINGPKNHTDITSREVKVKHILDHDDKSLYGFSAQFPIGTDSATNPVSATVDADFKQETYTGATQATISEGAWLEVQKITDDLKKINRDLDKVQVGSSDKTHVRAVIPIINLEQVQNDIHRIKELIGADAKPASQEPLYEYELFDDEGVGAIPEDGKSQESQQSAHDKKADQKATSNEDAGPVVKKLKMTARESVTVDGNEAEAVTLDVTDANGKSLGQVRVGVFKDQTRKPKAQTAEAHLDGKTQATPFADANDQSTLLSQSADGYKYVVQGSKSILKKYGKTLLSIGVDFVPVVGTAKTITETIYGHDLVTGESINRWVSGAAIGLSLIPVVGPAAKNALKEGAVAVKGASVVKHVILKSLPGSAAHVGMAVEDGIKFNSMFRGPLHEIKLGGGTVADTFRSSTYVANELGKPVRLYRVYSREGSALGNYWSKIKPSGPYQATLDSGLAPNFNNLATHWVEIEVPVGRTIFEGTVGEVGKLVGGGNQVYVAEKISDAWVKAKGVFPKK